MKVISKLIITILCLFLPTVLYALSWTDLWQTKDQQGAKLLQTGKAKEAATKFKNKDWHAVANYRAGAYPEAYKQFIKHKTSDDQYNAGNAAAYSGQYKEALDAYNKAIALNPNNRDAITNREIIKKLLKKQQAQNKSCPKGKNSNDAKNNANNKSNDSQQQMSKNSQQNKENQNQNNQNQNQQNPQKSMANNTDQQKNGNPSQNQADGAQAANDQKLNANQQKQNQAAERRMQAKEEDKKQALRRLTDDPGGLLQQKFLRDYYRRHAIDDGSDQGGDFNAF